MPSANAPLSDIELKQWRREWLFAEEEPPRAPQGFLAANPINRYLINSPMLPELKKNSDGSITLYIQKDAPGADKEPNWLPAPDGPIYVVMRIYWPKEAALNGSWKPPAVHRVV